MILGRFWGAGAINVSPRGFVCGAGAENVSLRGLVCWCWGVVSFKSVLVLGLCGREVRLAWLVGGENGRKFAMHAQNTPKRAISSEQGEFYTAHAVRRGVQGEFYTWSGAVRLVRASFVSPWHLPCSLLPGFRRPRALRTGPAGFGMASMLVIEGVLQH